MSAYTIETIDLTETSRLRVEVDQDSSNPRKDWDMLTGFVKIRGRGDSRIIDVEPVHEAPIDISEALHRITVGTRRDAEATVERWARVFHDLHIEYDSEHGGYWFVDPSGFQQNFPAVPGGGKVARIRPVQVDGIFQANIYETYEQDALECQAEVIKNERETYRQWAEGEVHIVVLERLERYARVIDSGSDAIADSIDWDSTKDEWEQAEAIGGNYLDEHYTAQHVADENFSLTPAERDALGLKVRA